jgi:hypothetical protein
MATFSERKTGDRPGELVDLPKLEATSIFR